MKTRKSALIAVSSLAVVLTGCPGGMDTTKNITIIGTTKYSKIGVVGLSYITGVNNLSAVFTQVIDTSISQPPTILGLAEETCLVQTVDPTKVQDSIPGGDQPHVALDAGTELTVKRESKTLAVLKAQSITPPFGNPRVKSYTYDQSVGALDTSSATLEIPGAVGGFPAMTVTLPNQLPAFTFEPSTAVTKDTAFTWTSLVSGAFVMISASKGSGANSLSVSCVAKDDGSFAFPEITKAEMITKGFTASTSSSVIKFLSNTVIKEDTLLYISSSRMGDTAQ
jgi:hypothetical protein